MNDVQPNGGADAVDLRKRNRNRLALLGIVAIFVLPILIAGLIGRFGKIPAPTKQHGELLEPPLDLRSLTLSLADGSQYAWRPEARMRRILIVADAVCDRACELRGEQIAKVWQLMGKDADNVDVLWLCRTAACGTPASLRALPALKVMAADPALSAKLPGTAGTAYIIDPYGFVVLRYPPGTDPAGLRTDLAKLLKLN